MPDDVAAYLLLALNVLVVAVVLSLPILLVWTLVGRPRPVPPMPGDPEETGERVLRRCEDCGVVFAGRPGDDASVLALRLRRRTRRRTREAKKDTPAWARRRGYWRCPSCLSTNVRTSRASRS